MYRIFLIIIFLETFQTQATGFEKDSTSLQKILSNGKLKCSIRQYSMLTDNHAGLTDYYAVAVGAGLDYQTKQWKNWSLNFGGFFVHDIASSDFTKPDPSTNTLSRYDSGLFDILELNNQLISKIENLNIRYHFKQSKVVFGKQIIKSPLVNPQDGRMIPSMMEGIYFYWNEVKNLHIEGGYLYRASPRSTFKWLKTNESIGIFPMGVNDKGLKNNYAGNLYSAGLLMLGGDYKLTKNIQVNFWDYFIENIQNTVFGQWNHVIPTGKSKWMYALQIVSQQAIREGGNIDQNKSYISPNTQSLVWGMSVGKQWNKSKLNLNFTRITKKGAFIFPREWGRDAFFTFLARERNEGLGDVHAFSANFSQNFFKNKLQLDGGLGYYRLPDVKNFSLNKYGLPSYSQMNVSVKWTPKKFFDGIDLQWLLAKKWNQGNLHGEEKYRINKVDLLNHNLVINYNF